MMKNDIEKNEIEKEKEICSNIIKKKDDDLQTYIKKNISSITNIKNEKFVPIIFKNFFKISNIEHINISIQMKSVLFIKNLIIFIFKTMENIKSESSLKEPTIIENILCICYYYKEIDSILFQILNKEEEISITHYVLIIWILSLKNIINNNPSFEKFYNENINKFTIEEYDFEFECKGHKDLFIHILTVFTIFNFINITDINNNIFLIWRKLFKTYPKTVESNDKFTDFFNMLPISYNTFDIDKRLRLYFNGEIISYILNIINTKDDIEVIINHLEKFKKTIEITNIIKELEKLKESKIKEEEEKSEEIAKLLLEEEKREEEEKIKKVSKKEEESKEKKIKDINIIIGKIRTTFFREDYKDDIIKFDDFDKTRIGNIFDTNKIFGLIIFNYVKDYLIYFISIFIKDKRKCLIMLHGGICIQYYSNKNYKTYDLDYKFLSEYANEYISQLLSEDLIKFLNDNIKLGNILERKSESELNTYITSLKNQCTGFEFISITEKDRPIIKILLKFKYGTYDMKIQLIDITYESSISKDKIDIIKYSGDSEDKSSDIIINILKKEYVIKQLELHISDYNKLKKLLDKDIENDINVNTLTDHEKGKLKEFKTDNIKKVESDKYSYELYESVIRYGKKSIEQLNIITTTKDGSKSIRRKSKRRKSIRKSKRRKSIRKSIRKSKSIKRKSRKNKIFE